MISKININFYIKQFSFFFLILSFIFVFFFSFQTVIHNHSYSQIFINYSEGFIKNGLLGEIVFFLRKNSDLDIKTIVNTIYLIFHLSNIYLFIKIINPVLKYSRIIYIFIVLNPALILFPIYDIGAFLRKEVIIITFFLFHIYISQLLNYDLINKTRYEKIFIFCITPLLLIGSLIHSIQILFIPAHFFIFKLNKKNILDKSKLIFLIVIITLFFSQFFFHKNIDSYNLYLNTQELMGDFIKEINFAKAPYDFLTMSITERLVSTLPFFKNLHFLKFYTISVVIIFSILIFMLSKLIFYDERLKNSFVLLSIIPFFLLFFLASDWGRWIHIIAIIVLCLKLQLKIKNVDKFDYPILINFVLFLIVSFYLFFYNLSHCCIKNLFFFGMNQNIKLFMEILFDNLKIIEHIKY